MSEVKEKIDADLSGLDFLQEAAKTALSTPESDTPEPSDVSVDDINESLSPSDPALEPDSSFDDMPSFLDGKGVKDAYEATPDADSPAPATPSGDPDQAFEYKVGEETYKATAAEARKALELQRGARQAFSERAKLKRDMEALKAQLAENAQFKQKWEEALADPDPRAVFSKLTGQPFDRYLEQEIQRKNVWENATPDEKRLLEYDQRINQQDAEMARFKQLADSREADLKSQTQEADKAAFLAQFSPIMEEAFSPLESDDESIENTRWDMVQADTLRTIRKFASEGYEVNREMMKQIADQKVAALMHGVNREVTQKVDQVIEQKKADAQDRAQRASTQNYTAGLSVDKLSQLKPDELFRKMFRGG